MHWNPKLAVIYYGAGDLKGCRLALAAAQGAWDAGGEVRVRRVEPLAPPDGARAEPGWVEVLCEADDVPEVSAEDLVWADAVLFGTSIRDRAVHARLRRFVDVTLPFTGAIVVRFIDATADATANAPQLDDPRASSPIDAADAPTAAELAEAREEGRRLVDTVFALNASRSPRADVA